MCLQADRRPKKLSLLKIPWYMWTRPQSVWWAWPAEFPLPPFNTPDANHRLHPMSCIKSWLSHQDSAKSSRPPCGGKVKASLSPVLLSSVVISTSTCASDLNSLFASTFDPQPGQHCEETTFSYQPLPHRATPCSTTTSSTLGWLHGLHSFSKLPLFEIIFFIPGCLDHSKKTNIKKKPTCGTFY